MDIMDIEEYKPTFSNQQKSARARNLDILRLYSGS